MPTVTAVGAVPIEAAADVAVLTAFVADVAVPAAAAAAEAVVESVEFDAEAAEAVAEVETVTDYCRRMAYSRFATPETVGPNFYNRTKSEINYTEPKMQSVQEKIVKIVTCSETRN